MTVTVVMQTKAAKGSTAIINSFQKAKAYCTPLRPSLSENGKTIFMRPSIPLGSVNEYQLRLVWFIPLAADVRGVYRYINKEGTEAEQNMLRGLKYWFGPKCLKSVSGRYPSY